MAGPSITRRELLGGATGVVAATTVAAGSLGVALSSTSVQAAGADADVKATAPASAGICRLYPHESPSRTRRDLSGLWQFRLDPNDEGEAAGWSGGFEPARAIPVPSSWNELFDDARNYFGTAWYQTEFMIERGWRGQRVLLRFGSACYRARVWLNGVLLGEHLGGHLPFEFDVSAAARYGADNRLVVLVENLLLDTRVPAGVKPGGSGPIPSYPGVTFDFFPYAGLHRPVHLYATPRTHFEDLVVRTAFDGADGLVDVEVVAGGRWNGSAELSVDVPGGAVRARVALVQGRGHAQLRIPAVRAWSPASPHLYTLTARLVHAEHDEYRLRFGVRTVHVEAERLLLNGKPVHLNGFGKHEDFFIHGKGLDLPVLVRDYELMRWTHANSFRTSHYPYSDEALQLADEQGWLVIAESPAVSLSFTDAPEVIEARRVQLVRALEEMVARDKNHASIIAWSLANEPGIVAGGNGPTGAERAQVVERGTAFFKPLFEQVRTADATRPLTLVSVNRGPDEWIALTDFVCTNLYFGWYYGGSGQLDTVAPKALRAELERLHSVHPGKPIVITEFGADTYPGTHAQPAEMWSEEYQAQMMQLYIRTARSYPFVAGAQVWAFADFRTTQGIIRTDGLNYKGVFTRERRPKLAAHVLRELWAPPA